MTDRRLIQLARFGAVVMASMFALSFVVSARAFADSSTGASASIGVQVDQPTTSLPAVSTTAPPTTVASVINTTTTPPSTTSTTSTIPAVPTTDTLPEVLPTPVTVTPSTDGKGFTSQLKSAARTTKDLINGVISGKPVADVAQAVLPQNVATVVVPAVRTASTFVFPIGLAAAVIAFLALQQRIDSGDPKLIAAPMAHDDDLVEFS